jgi:hypothetical protein
MTVGKETYYRLEGADIHANVTGQQHELYGA